MVINRIAETKYSTLSTWVIAGTTLKGYILEPGGPSSTTPDDGKRIAAGEYGVELKCSPHMKRYMLYLTGVSGKTDIMLHWGNNPSNTIGCLLTGRKRGKRQVKFWVEQYGETGEHNFVFGNTRETYLSIKKAFIKHGLKNVRIKINEISK